MPTMSITVEADDTALSLIEHGLSQTQHVTLTPHTFGIGINVKVITYETTEETQ